MADKFGRFLHDRRHIFVGRFYWPTKSANFIVRLTSALRCVRCVGWKPGLIRREYMSACSRQDDSSFVPSSHAPSHALYTRWCILHSWTACPADACPLRHPPPTRSQVIVMTHSPVFWRQLPVPVDWRQKLFSVSYFSDTRFSLADRKC